MAAIDGRDGPGKRMLRVEDGPLLRGMGRFVDDFHLPEMLHVAILRSPVAHARLKSIDASHARKQAGIHAVLSYADIRPLLTQDRIPLAIPASAIRFHVDPFPLVRDEICYVGESIALVVAESRSIAEDALALIELDYEVLPAVLDPVAGLEPSAPKARLDCPDNLVARHQIDYGDVDGAFAKAAHHFSERFRLSKGGGHAIETRGLIARPDPVDGVLTVWANTQMPHRAKSMLVATLGLPEHQVRIIVPDTGGGFGPKAVFHPEELAIPAAALLLQRPLKWIEDRRENFAANSLERDQDWEMEAAFDTAGRLLGIRGNLRHDHGAATPYGVALPYNAGTNLVGPYVLPAFRLAIALCLTNLVPVAPTRGAGRPQGMYVMERMLDRAAEKLGLGRDEIRRRNLIQPEQMPFTTPILQRDGSPMTYDSGDYPESQRLALEAIGWTEFAARQDRAREQGRYIGLGIANYVEATGRGPFESASLRIGASGKVMVTTGASAQGQGTKSMLVQLVHEVLGVAPEDVVVSCGDTAQSPLGLGAFASRQAVTAGNAIHLAALAVRDKAIQAASEMLEASPEDLEVKDGAVQVKGVPQMKKSLGEIARVLGGVPGFSLPRGVTPGLASASDFEPPALTYCNGTHAAEVQVDPETGEVRLTRYIVVHDCGRLINPMIVEGQVQGAVVHGIGATLFERMHYDDAGQPQSVTYADYLLPTTDVVPPIEIVHMETPTPLNPLGVKGAAESGTIAAPAAIASAVEDALRPFGVHITDLPITPDRLHALIHRAQSSSLS